MLTGVDKCKPMLTGVDKCKPMLTGVDKRKPMLTGVDKCKKGVNGNKITLITIKETKDQGYLHYDSRLFFYVSYNTHFLNLDPCRLDIHSDCWILVLLTTHWIKTYIPYIYQ